MGYASGLHRDALIATGVVLLVFILLLTACFSLLKRRARP
jgi:phosphate transport system permease protein